MIKEQDLRKVMENDPETVSDFEREIQGQTHLHSTSECSRGASGLFDAYAVLNYPGGAHRAAHCRHNVHYFRCRLRAGV